MNCYTFKKISTICHYTVFIGVIVGFLSALSSCTQEIGTRGKRTGEKIEVSFFLGASNYDESEESVETRAAVLSEPENVTVGLDDGWVAVASFEEDHEEIKTRAKTSGTTRLTTGSKLMIVAYESSTPTVVDSQAEYVVNPDGSISPTGFGLWVIEDLDYRFIAYSYDKSFLPDPANIDTAEDLLWGCFPENVNNFHRVTEVSNLIGINLEHLFSAVKVRATVLNGSIQSISGVIMTGKPTTTVTLNVPAGSFGSVSGNTNHNFDFDPFVPATSVTSKPSITWAISNPQVRITSINISNTVNSNIQFIFNGTTLTAGNSYTLTLQFYRRTYSISPATINIPWPAQTPVTQTISITTAPSAEPWTLTSGASSWLRLNTNGGSTGTPSVSGTGAGTVYMVADENQGSQRTAPIYLSTVSPTEIRVTVNQALFPYVLCGGLWVLASQYYAQVRDVINGTAPCPAGTRLPNTIQEGGALVNNQCYNFYGVMDYYSYNQNLNIPPGYGGTATMWYLTFNRDYSWRTGSWSGAELDTYTYYRCLKDPQ